MKGKIERERGTPKVGMTPGVIESKSCKALTIGEKRLTERKEAR